MLLATHNARRELCLYRLRIDWDHDTLDIQHLTFLTLCSPVVTVEEASQATFDHSSQNARLTLLDLIPAGPESKSRTSTRPFILAAFLYLASDFDGPESVRSVLCKWEIRQEKSCLK